MPSNRIKHIVKNDKTKTNKKRKEEQVMKGPEGEQKKLVHYSEFHR